MDAMQVSDRSSAGMFDDIVRLLRDEGKLSEEKIQDCLKIREKSGSSLDKILLAKGYLSEPEVLKIFSIFLALEYLGDLREVTVPKEFLDSVPVHFARNYNLIGLGSVNGSMQIATCDPFEIHPMDELAATQTRLPARSNVTVVSLLIAANLALRAWVWNLRPRPLSGAMDHTQDFDPVRADPVNDHQWRNRNDEFPCSG